MRPEFRAATCVGMVERRGAGSRPWAGEKCHKCETNCPISALVGETTPPPASSTLQGAGVAGGRFDHSYRTVCGTSRVCAPTSATARRKSAAPSPLSFLGSKLHTFAGSARRTDAQPRRFSGAHLTGFATIHRACRGRGTHLAAQPAGERSAGCADRVPLRRSGDLGLVDRALVESWERGLR